MLSSVGSWLQYDKVLAWLHITSSGVGRRARMSREGPGSSSSWKLSCTARRQRVNQGLLHYHPGKLDAGIGELNGDRYWSRGGGHGLMLLWNVSELGYGGGGGTNFTSLLGRPRNSFAVRRNLFLSPTACTPISSRSEELRSRRMSPVMRCSSKFFARCPRPERVNHCTTLSTDHPTTSWG